MGHVAKKRIFALFKRLQVLRVRRERGASVQQQHETIGDPPRDAGYESHNQEQLRGGDAVNDRGTDSFDEVEAFEDGDGVRRTNLSIVQTSITRKTLRRSTSRAVAIRLVLLFIILASLRALRLRFWLMLSSPCG